MKHAKLLLALLLVAGVLAYPAIAQEQAIRARARIKLLGALGQGIAVSSSDPMDFNLVKLVVGRVAVTAAGVETDVKLGVLVLGEDKYRLRNIVISNGSLSADIYKENDNVGSLDVDLYVKGDRNVWAGSMKVGDESYNVYIVAAKRRFKPMEAARRGVEYCKNNPEKCKALVKAVGKFECDKFDDESCREKIVNFCSSHPKDRRCKVIKYAYCAANPEDERCRNELVDKCKDNPDTLVCRRFARIVKIKPAEKVGEVVGERVVRAVPRWIKRIKEARVVEETNASVEIAPGENVEVSPLSIVGSVGATSESSKSEKA